MDVDAATAKFTQALPFVLAPVSSQLAALQNARSKSQQPYSCSRCGSLFTLRMRSGKQAISATCSACGGVSNTSRDRGNALSFPRRKRRRTAAGPDISESKSQEQLPTSTITASSTASSTIKHTSTVGDHATKSDQPIKAKKKPGLQEMLQRNREKEKKRRQNEQAKPGGLSAFLSTL